MVDSCKLSNEYSDSIFGKEISSAIWPAINFSMALKNQLFTTIYYITARTIAKE